MRHEQMKRALDEAFPGSIYYDGYGFVIGKPGDEKVLRFECGGGIAGQMDVWELRFPGTPDMKPYGPIRSKRDLARTVRELVRDLVRAGDGASFVLYGWR